MLLLSYMLLSTILCDSLSAQIIQRGRLKGDVEFTYERVWRNSEFIDSRSKSFVQRYNLGFIDYANYDYNFSGSQSVSGSETDVLRYGVSSTILSHPAFRFPITFFASRTTTDTSDHIDREREANKYGVKWLFKFRLLPRTKLGWRKEEVTSDGRKRESSTFDVDMDKGFTIGKTNYRFRLRKGGGVADYGSENDFTGFTATADTTFSNTARLDQGASYFESSSVGDGGGLSFERTTKNYNARLMLNPSEDFSHSYSYSFTESKDQSGVESSVHSFFANATYRLNPRLSFTTNLGYAKAVFDDSVEEPADREESDNKTTRRSASFNVRFRLTNRTTTRYRIHYSRGVTLHGPDTYKRIDERRGIGAGISHARPFKSFSVGVSYNIDYSHYKIPLDEVEGGEQESSNTLSNNFALTASSVGWRYFNLNGSYEFVDKRGTFKEDEERSHRLRLDARSNYFKRTVIRAYLVKYVRERYGTPKSDTTTFFARINHNRNLWRGVLRIGGSVFLGLSDNTLRGTSVSANTSYGRALTKRLIMSLGMVGTVSDSRGGSEPERRTQVSFRSSFKYFLRAWTATLEYEYQHRTDELFGERVGISYTSEHRIFVKLERQFIAGLSI